MLIKELLIKTMRVSLSVLLRDTISSLEDVQYCGGIPSELWRMFSTVEGYHHFCGEILSALRRMSC